MVDVMKNEGNVLCRTSFSGSVAKNQFYQILEHIDRLKQTGFKFEKHDRIDDKKKKLPSIMFCACMEILNFTRKNQNNMTPTEEIIELKIQEIRRLHKVCREIKTQLQETQALNQEMLNVLLIVQKRMQLFIGDEAWKIMYGNNEVNNIIEKAKNFKN